MKISKKIIKVANNQGENVKPNDKEKEVYFILIRPSEEKIDFKNIKFKSDIIPKIIFNKSILKENESYLEEIVFKFKKK